MKKGGSLIQAVLLQDFTKVSLEQCEEADWLKEIGPCALVHENVTADLQASPELLGDNVARGACHIEGGVLLRICWRDDGH